MLKPSDFNKAVPQFQNGNYASNPINPQYVEEPSSTDYNRGSEPLQTLPAQWWNWFMNKFTSRFNKVNIYVKNLFNELAQLLSLVDVTPDGTEGAVTDGQLKNAFEELYPTYVSDKLELGTTYVKKTQKVNSHALSGDITISKSDVGLGNVANTEDSATPVSGGTTKFTTGGAYNLLTSIAPYFSSSIAYTVGQLVTYQNRLYECTTAHSAGAWNASHFTARSVQSVISNYILPSLAPAFSTSTSYAVGAFVTYQNRLYRCKATHSAGAWNTSHFELANINNVSVDTDGKLALKADLLDLAPAFSTSLNYSVGDYVTYNGNLYRCTVAHSAGAWNASHFTDVTVGGELETKADKTSLALPTDAVLHYSFDDVPDIPDGTADEKNLSGNTYGVQFSGNGTITTDPYVAGDGKIHLSNVNGNANYKSDVSTLFSRGVYKGLVSYRGKIVIIEINAKTSNLNIMVEYRADQSDTTQRFYPIGTNISLGRHKIVLAVPSNCYVYAITFYAQQGADRGEYTEWELLNWYVGDGSYITPIIDNANGQNNATNNGGIAVNGVSGKGVYLANGKYILTSNFNLSTDFSVSIWVKPDNSTSGLNGEIIRSIGQFIIRNGDTDNSVFSVIIWTSETLTYKSIGRLLSEGVWTHIVVTRSGTSMKLYLNGILTNTWTLNSENLQPATQSYSLGSSINTRPQSFDDLLIFDRALTDDEVTALYLNKANTPKYYGEVPVTRKINGHTLEEDITLTKADVGLSNVANTGDSAVPAKNGTKKFTTGGAFDFFGGNTNSKTWLTKLFSRTIGNSWTDSLDLTTSGTQFASAYGKGVWVVASQRGTFWSENLTSWTPITGVSSESHSIEFKDGIFVLGTRNAGVWWSENGKSFTLATGISGSLSVTTTHVGEIWLASTNTNAWWSNNGKSWTTCVGTSDGIMLSAIDYGNGKYFAGKSNGGLITSNDGKTWSSVSNSLFDYNTNAVKYTNGIWLIGTYRTGYNKNIITSKDDGSNWYEENITVNGYVSDIWTVGNNAIVTWNGSNSQTQIITLGINEENSCIIHHESIDYTISTFIEIFGTYFAFTFPGQLMRSTNLLVWENTFAKAESSGLNTFIFAENKLLYTSQVDGAQFSEIDLNAV